MLVHGDSAEIEFHGQTDQAEVGPAFRLQVPIVETLEEYKRDEEGKDEVENGRRLMLETVIEGPVGHEGIEEIVFDVPPAVCHTPEHPCRQPGCRKRRHPPPVVQFRLLDPSVAMALSDRDLLLGVENP